jgi:acetylornithine/succinyldiaminopimelate/putrescine aminotransferase
MSSRRDLFLRHVAQTSPAPDGFEVGRADGIYLYDPDGMPYIDGISGIAVSSFGHQHDYIRDAIRAQLDTHLHTSVYGEHIQAPQVELARRLAECLPSSLDCAYFTSSGAEAVEGALKLARRYTGRYEIIACRNAYHGSTAGAESLRSDHAYTAAARPLVPGIRHIDFNDAGQLDQIDRTTAAVILETVQGEAGVIEPAPGYLRALRTRCTAVGALLIFDEIQAGMGRTGTLWAFEQENVKPDVLLLAKAFGAGLPLGAFIAARPIMQVLSHDPILGHINTFGGHPLSCAASLAALDLLARTDLLRNVRTAGTSIKAALSGHPAVREVRGRGLMLAVELRDPSRLQEAIRACRDERLLVDWFLFNDRSIRLYPPLTITAEEVADLIGRMTRALDRITDNG